MTDELIPCVSCGKNTVHVTVQHCWQCADKARRLRNLEQTWFGMPFGPLLWSLVFLVGTIVANLLGVID